MHLLKVDRNKRGNFLDLIVWDDDSGYIHTGWTICELHNSEVDFFDGSRGGRFHKFEPGLRTHCVSLPLTDMNKKTIFKDKLEWIAEYVVGDWSFDIAPHEPVPIGGGMGLVTVEADLLLYFADPDDAVLFKLKFA